jgi:hypothetical protein
MTIGFRNKTTAQKLMKNGLNDQEEHEIGTEDRVFRVSHFEKLSDAQEWAHRESLRFDTDEECQEECERLLKTQMVTDRDGERWYWQSRGTSDCHGPFGSRWEAEADYASAGE